MKLLATVIKKIPWVIIALIVAATLFFGYKIKDLKIEADIGEALPKDFPEVKYFDRVNEIFPKQEFIIVGLVTDDIFTPETIRKIDTLTNEFKNLQGIGQVLSPTSLDIIEGTEEGIEVMPILDKLPETDKEVTAFENEITSNPLYKDTFISKDGNAAIILIQIEDDDAKEGLLKTIREIIDRNKEDGEIYRIAGEAATFAEMKNIIINDLVFLSPIVVFVIVFILFLSFRNLWGVILPILTVIMSVIWTVGIMSILKIPLSIMTTVVPVILIAIGSAYGIHIINRYIYDLKNGTDKEQAISKTIKHTGIAVLMAGLTTMAGFLSFLSSKIDIIRYFGLFTAVGVVCALLFSVTFIPAILYLQPIPKKLFGRKNSGKKERSISLNNLLSKLGNFVFAKKAVVLLVALGIVAVSVIGMFRLQVESDLVQMFGEKTKMMQDNKFFNENFSGTMTLQIIIESDESDKMKEPEILQRIDDLQQYVDRFDMVGGTQSISDIIKEMNKVMNEDKEEFRVIPDSKNLVSQYLLLYSLTGDESTLENLVNYDYSQANITVFIKSINLTALKALGNDINQYIEDNFNMEGIDINITGNISIFMLLSDLIVQSQFLSILISLILVFIITAIIFRSPILGLISTIPIIITICLNFGLMGLLNIPLDLATVLIASVAIGIGIDYSIHYISHYKTERLAGVDGRTAIINTNSITGKAIIYNASAVGFGFLVLVFSSMASIGILGAMIALTMFVSSLGSLTVIPAVFTLMEKTKVFRKAINKKAAKALETEALENIN